MKAYEQAEIFEAGERVCKLLIYITSLYSKAYIFFIQLFWLIGSPPLPQELISMLKLAHMFL